MSKLVNLNFHSDKPVQLTETHIRRLFDEIKTILNSDPLFTIGYTDRSSIQNAELEDLINDENRKGRNITKVMINGKKDNLTIELWFGFGIDLKISGPDRQSVFIIQSQILDRIKTFETPYPHPYVMVIIFLLIYSITVILIIVYLLSPYFEKEYMKTHSTQLFIIAGILIFGGLIWKLILKWYPTTIFLIGDEIERQSKVTKLKSNFFWVVIVGLILTIVGTLLSKGI